MRTIKNNIVAALLLIGIVRLYCSANTRQETTPIGIVEKLGQTLPRDVELYDEHGNLVTLQSIQNKPTIFTFVYFRCAGICSPLLTEVTKIVNKMDLQLGKDYQIITVSFDSDEKPELAAEKRKNYLNEIHAKIDSGGWHFYTSDSANIHKLTDAAGFYFKRSNNEWLHVGVLIVTSPDGKIARYLDGIHHLPFDVKLALIEASEGKTGPTIAKVLDFCYSYDPQGKTYTFNVTRISLVLVLGFVGLFLIVFIIRPKRNSSSTTDKQ